jgi:hypothetical protein
MHTVKSDARRGDLVAFRHGDRWVLGVVWSAPHGIVDQAHVFDRDGGRRLVDVYGTRWVADRRDHQDLDFRAIAVAFAGRRFTALNTLQRTLARHAKKARARARSAAAA